MHRTLPFALAAVLAAIPAAAGLPVADLEFSLRCAAAFGIVADEQKRGIASALEFPPLAVRGREFFVQVGARVMDEQRLSRAGLQARFKAEVEALQAQSPASADPRASVAAIMAPCLELLDATVPAAPDAGRTP